MIMWIYFRLEEWFERNIFDPLQVRDFDFKQYTKTFHGGYLVFQTLIWWDKIENNAAEMCLYDRFKIDVLGTS